MSSAVFLTTVDVKGVMKTGAISFRATIIEGNHWHDIDLGEDPVLQNGGERVQTRMQRLHQDPKKAAAIARVRQRVAGQIKSDPSTGSNTGLMQLRLDRGLSQHMLAEKMQTQQSNISRWEKNPGNMELATMGKLAKALGISIQDVTLALLPTTEVTANE